MSISTITEIVAYCIVVLLLAILFGNYIATIYSDKKTYIKKVLWPVESFIYKICGISQLEQSWGKYAVSLLLFNFVGFVALFTILFFQKMLPLNSNGFPGLSADLAFNTAISFVTNTNWQAYSGESALSYFSQMTGLTVQNFLSSATGIAVLMALIRALTRNGMLTVGNFYTDVVRAILYILLPLAIIGAILLVWQGVPQNLNAYTHVETLEGAEQVIPQGPVASQLAIKQIGTNGGGFFAANSAHPYENPTPFTNLLQIVFMLLIPVALTRTYGKMVGDARQGWSIFAVMALLFIASLTIAVYSENKIHPAFSQYGIISNMEGKEVRFGVPASVFWSVVTTATSSGSVNSVHDSYMPLSGMMQLVNIMLGEVTFGGVGSGFYGMMIFVIITVFIAGLMVGRTPEYLGKKIEVREIKLSILAMLAMPLCVLGIGAVSILLPAGVSSIGVPGPHGLTQFLYAHTSAAGNNGSAFSGFNANTTYNNIVLGVGMIIGRFFFVLPVLAIAGSLVRKHPIPASSGTFPTYGLQFIGLLLGVVLIVGGLTFFPVLVLGPVLEHLMIG